MHLLISKILINFLGLGTISIGSIIFFVGTGEKGFKTQELRLIGPVLACEYSQTQISLNIQD